MEKKNWVISNAWWEWENGTVGYKRKKRSHENILITC